MDIEQSGEMRELSLPHTVFRENSNTVDPTQKMKSFTEQVTIHAQVANCT